MMKRHTVKELQSMIADHSASSQEIYKLYNNRIRAMNDSINQSRRWTETSEL